MKVEVHDAEAGKGRRAPDVLVTRGDCKDASPLLGEVAFRIHSSVQRGKDEAKQRAERAERVKRCEKGEKAEKAEKAKK